MNELRCLFQLFYTKKENKIRKRYININIHKTIIFKTHKITQNVGKFTYVYYGSDKIEERNKSVRKTFCDNSGCCGLINSTWEIYI